MEFQESSHVFSSLWVEGRSELVWLMFAYGDSASHAFNVRATSGGSAAEASR